MRRAQLAKIRVFRNDGTSVVASEAPNSSVGLAVEPYGVNVLTLGIRSGELIDEGGAQVLVEKELHSAA